jgi:NAD(P)-dependent dehydrogenase (short-subunit alcohol dehydrogenase family)
VSAGAPLNLNGRAVLVTGAGKGIGRAIAFELAARGASVMCASRDEASVAAVAAEITGVGGRAECVSLDVRDESSAERAVGRVVEVFGGLQGLVNNAGVARVQLLKDADIRAWKDVIDTNLTGAFLCSRAAVDALARSGHGAIVNVGSVNGILAMKGLSSYCASKGGLHQLTRELALELADSGIRVNCVAPGFVRTDMFESGHTEERKHWIASLHAIGRVGEADEIAPAVAFLCSDLASFITGAVLPVDGGLTVQYGLDAGGPA